MNLDRHNYEEYFILYLDNELDSESRRQVEDFAQANPDLKAELDMLLQSKLNPDPDIVFDNKESLLFRNRSSVSLANYGEWLLSYIDNELTEKQRKDVERLAAVNPAVQTELALLQKAKLQPEAIVFPDKESLYRREEKARVIPVRWWRIAAAAVLLLGISTTAIVLLNKNRQKGVAQSGSEEKKPAENTASLKKQPETLPGRKDSAVRFGQQKNQLAVNESNDRVPRKNENKITSKKNNKEKSLLATNPDTSVFVDNNNEKRPTNNLPQPTDENRYAKNQIDQKNIITPVPKDKPVFTKSALTKNNENPEFAKVTDQDAQSSYTGQQSGGNKGLRGFLRKVTRTFEKRTNIKATDDDDRLLIAGLAIKLN